MRRNLRVNTYLKAFGSYRVETKVMYVVMHPDESLDELVQMSYGCWYDVISYTTENAEIMVTPKFIQEEAIAILKTI